MIKLSLDDLDNYRLEIISSDSWDKDQERIDTLPIRRGIWIDQGESEAERFSHWQIPRVDVAEIYRLWEPSEIIATSEVKRDWRTYQYWSKPADPANQFRGRITAKPPHGKKFYPHQEEYMRLDPERRRVLCPLDTGMGKTLAAIGRADVHGFKRMLICTISGVFTDWKKEIRYQYGDEALEYAGTIRQRKKLAVEQLPSARFVLATYQMAAEIKQEFDAFILDEADLLSNPETKRFKTIQPVFDATWRHPKITVQALTATPMGNHARTAWAAFYIIHPLIAGSYRGFQMRHEKVVETATAWISKTDAAGNKYGVLAKVNRKTALQNRKQLRKKIEAIAFQPTKKFEFPFEDRERIIRVEMSDGQREFYDELKENLEAYAGRRRIKVKEARTKMLRLLQAAEGLFNFDEELVEESGKLEYIARVLRKADHKIIVWSRFKAITHILHQMFPHNSVMYNGSLTREEKMMSKWAFAGVGDESERKEYERLVIKAHEKNPNRKYFKAGRAQFLFGVLHKDTTRGMNLQACAHQILASLTLSGFTWAQTRGRILRLGQKAPVVRTDIVLAEDSCEDAVFNYVKQKLADMRYVITGSGDEVLTEKACRDLIKLMIK